MKIPVDAQAITRYLGRALDAVGKIEGVTGGAARVAKTLLNMDEKSVEDRVLIALRDRPRKMFDLVASAGTAAALPPAIENLYKLRLIATEDVEGELVVSLTKGGEQVAKDLK